MQALQIDTVFFYLQHLRHSPEGPGGPADRGDPGGGKFGRVGRASGRIGMGMGGLMPDAGPGSCPAQLAARA